MDESEIRVGDRFRIGTTELVVTQPRIPCFKLGIRFNDQSMVKRFMDARRTGFYVRVINEGEIGPGDEVELLHRNPDRIRMVDVVNVFAFDKHNIELLNQAITSEEMAEGWRDRFQQQLDAIEV
jgi:MOSC domain-containing protein YiiM